MHAKIREHRNGLRGLVEPRQPQPRQRSPQFMAIADRGIDPVAGQQQRGSRIGCQHDAGAIAQFRNAGADAPAQRTQSAEQAQAAADLDQDFIRRSQADGRRELRCPCSDAGQRFRFLCAIPGADVQSRRQRVGRGHRHAGLDARFRRGLVARQHPWRVARFLHDDRSAGSAAAQIQLQRQIRKTQRSPQHDETFSV